MSKKIKVKIIPSDPNRIHVLVKENGSVLIPSWPSPEVGMVEAVALIQAGWREYQLDEQEEAQLLANLQKKFK